MKQKIARAAAVLGFIVLTAVCLHKIYDVLRWKDTTGGYLSSIDQLYNTDEGLIDLVFMGSSHCYYGIYPELLWEEKGIAGFDLAVSAQDKDSTYSVKGTFKDPASPSGSSGYLRNLPRKASGGKQCIQELPLHEVLTKFHRTHPCLWGAGKAEGSFGKVAHHTYEIQGAERI